MLEKYETSSDQVDDVTPLARSIDHQRQWLVDPKGLVSGWASLWRDQLDYLQLSVVHGLVVSWLSFDTDDVPCGCKHDDIDNGNFLVCLVCGTELQMHDILSYQLQIEASVYWFIDPLERFVDNFLVTIEATQIELALWMLYHLVMGNGHLLLEPSVEATRCNVPVVQLRTY